MNIGNLKCVNLGFCYALCTMHYARQVAILLVGSVLLLSAICSAEPSPKPLSPEDISVPKECGRIIETWSHNNINQSPIIIHIQDLHTHPEAQYNLAKILAYLEENYGIITVGSEGAVSKVDTSILSGFPIAEIREDTADALLRAGMLTGEEYFSITQYPQLEIWGVEESDIYAENITHFNDVMKDNHYSLRTIGQLKGILEELKRKMYTKHLYRLDEKEKAFENDEASLESYLAYLDFYVKKFKIDIATRYPNAHLLITAMEEKKTDDEEHFKNLQPQKLYKELPQLKEEIENHLFTRDYQRTLRDLTKAADILEDFFQLQISNEDLDYYKKSQVIPSRAQASHTLTGTGTSQVMDSPFSISTFKVFIEQWAKRYGIEYAIDFNPVLIDEKLPKLEKFYEIVAERDYKMVSILLEKTDEVTKRNTNDGRRDTGSIAVLIAGGFHTQGITEILREKGYSYVVVAPQVAGEMDYGRYHKILRREYPTPKEILEEKDGL